MKFSILIKVILAVTVLSNIGCNNSNRTTDKTERIPDDNNFVFKGIMHKGAGLELSVHYPSQGFDKRYKSKIVDSTFNIVYPKRENEIITLRIEESIQDNHSSVWTPKFIAEDIIFECTMDSLLGRFLVPKDGIIIKGDSSIVYRKKLKEYFTYFRSKREGLDTLDKKQSILKGYENLYYMEPGSFHSVYSLYYLLYESRIPISDFSLDQQELIKSYFINLNKKFEGNYYYELARQKIFGSTVQIGDDLRSFQLEQYEGIAVDLKSLAAGKNLVIIEFWHSRCSPCRTFNKSFREKYEKYRKLGFEIISVNTDESKNDWIRSSKNDSILWLNLYAGQNSEIENYFEILVYPTRAIYDEKLKLIKFGRIGEEELKRIIERSFQVKEK